MTRFNALLALFLLIGASLPLTAQEQTAFIQGGVIDMSGAALPGVTIEAANAKGHKYTTFSDSIGHYRFPALPPGTYRITASLSGMQSSTVKNIVLTLGSSPKIDLALKVAAVAETVTVTAEAPLVDMSSNATAASIRSENFEKLPKGRDFTSLVTQAAAANQDNKAGGISIDGASGSENVYIVDGVDTTNPQTGISGKTVITDFVDEVQVKSAGYAAEFGGAIGGVINVITKTGTNDFRGSAQMYYTPYSMSGAARPSLEVNATPSGDVAKYVTYPKDEGHDVEPGFTIGGPVMKDALWFFAAYEPFMRTIDRTPQGWATTYSQDFQRDNGVVNINGVGGSKITYKAAYNTSGYKTTNLLPNANGRSSTDPAAYAGKNDKFTNWTASGYVDFIATPQFFMSAKGGRFDRNYTQQGISSDIRYIYSGSPSVFPDAPASVIHPTGWSSIPTNTASVKDRYTRDNLDFDASFFPQWMGSHRIKVGAQFTNLKNDVFNGEQNLRETIYWNRAEPATGVKGTYGALRLRQFGTFGNVSSNNTGLFLQDSWTLMSDRLTLNIGVRAEDEKVPSYATEGVVATNAIHWSFSDKLAPRLGFSYDLRGNGRTKLYGSYGKFYDIMKMELPRGSFGGDKWIDAIFKLETLDVFNMNCTGYSTSITTRPTCNGAIWVTNRDYRHPSNSADKNLIDPNLKPMESQEFTIGAQHEMSPTLAFGVRYVRKNLVRTIEDSGVQVTNPDGSTAEEYFIANPGEGVAKYLLGPTMPALPKAKRDYNGFELEATKRFGNRWSLHATYLYSTLKGNYSGLANSDEAQVATPGTARTSPNVNRAFDNLFNLFDEHGKLVYGNLATDRPHQIKAQVAYAFPFGLTAGINQYSASGTPFSTEFLYEAVPYFAYGRGDMGRSPWYNQTDLNLVQDIRLGRSTLQLGVNVLNLFDSDTAVNIYDAYSQNGLDATISNTQFFKGFDSKAACAAQKCTLDASYGKANAFQAPREVRFNVRLMF